MPPLTSDAGRSTQSLQPMKPYLTLLILAAVSVGTVHAQIVADKDMINIHTDPILINGLVEFGSAAAVVKQSLGAPTYEAEPEWDEYWGEHVGRLVYGRCGFDVVDGYVTRFSFFDNRLSVRLKGVDFRVGDLTESLSEVFPPSRANRYQEGGSGVLEVWLGGSWNGELIIGDDTILIEWDGTGRITRIRHFMPG